MVEKHGSRQSALTQAMQCYYLSPPRSRLYWAEIVKELGGNP